MTGSADVLSIGADVGELARVRAFVRERVGRAGAPQQAIDDLVQAVDESVCNVITHGYDGQTGTVDIEIETPAAAEAATVRIRDTCPSFDPTTVPTPDVDAPLAARRLGGMGIHLARDLTDEMRHRILPSGGNELTLVKSWRSSGGAETDAAAD